MMQERAPSDKTRQGQHERWSALLDILGRDRRLEVEAAAAQLGVSTATIRRDLDQLAQQQLLVRTRGGAAPHGVSYELPLRYKATHLATEKSRIGLAAAKLVAAGSVVGLNGGTTTTEVARALGARSELIGRRDAPGITVVTNALNIASELVVRPHIKLVVTGGVARPQSYELIGPLAMPILEELTLDHAIIGVDAIDAELGASTHHEGEASINRSMASRAAQVIVVADSSKLGRKAFSRICPIDWVHVLVTDTGAGDALVEPFADAGVRVIRA